MAHNRSPSKLRSDGLGSPVQIYAAWVLEIECASGNCPVGRVHRLESLARHYPAETVGGLLRRLRCVACGKGPASAVLVGAYLRRRVPLRGSEVSY